MAGDRAPSGPILGVRTDGLEMKEALLASNPAVFFTTPHFDGYPAVLVRLGTISGKDLHGLVTDAWLVRAPKHLVAEFLRTRSPAPAARSRGRKGPAT